MPALLTLPRIGAPAIGLLAALAVAAPAEALDPPGSNLRVGSPEVKRVRDGRLSVSFEFAATACSSDPTQRGRSSRPD